ncbi:MAG: hypothetical protein ACTSUE_27585 [Promethearchaeota archaeon]
MIHHQIPNFHECDVCQKNISTANHYCHDCRTIFCSGCVISEKNDVLVCSECGLNLLATDPRTGDYYCKQCHDSGNLESRLVTVTREKSVCPKCRSANTSEIPELKSSLKEKYKNIILDTRTILDDFQSFTSFLSVVNQKLLKVRVENPSIIHEPHLEVDVLGIMNEAIAIERRILHRLNNFFLFLKSKKQYFFSTLNWRNEDFSNLETYINQLQSDFLMFIGQVAENFNQPLDMLQNIRQKLEFLESVKEFFQKYIMKGVISLKTSEFPVMFVDNVKLESDDDNTKGHGHILLTNKHFFFVKSQGMWKKVDTLQFSFPIDKLLSTEIKGRLLKRVNLQFQGINLKFGMEKKKIQQLMSTIKQIFTFDADNKLNPGNVEKIKGFDINSIFKMKTYIESNINDLLSAVPEPPSYGYRPPNNVVNQNYGDPRGTGTGGIDLDLNFAADAMVTRAMDEGGLDDGGFDDAIEFKDDPYTGSPPGFFPGDPPRRSNSMESINANIMKFNRFQERVMRQQPRKSMDGARSRFAQASAPSNHMHQDGAFGSRAREGEYRQTRPVSAGNRAQQAYQPNLRDGQREIRYLMNMLKTYEHKIISIKQTLQNLETKFDRGKIGPNVYFQTHQLFKEKLVAIHQDMQQVKNQLYHMQPGTMY